MARSDLRGATAGRAVTPSDTTELSGVRALYVGGTGDVAVRWDNGLDVTHVGVQGGSVLTIQPARVLATGTTATGIVAWF